jgi:hypothetical protein
MVNYALREYGGCIHQDRAAAVTGQRGDTIRAGFDWLIAHGDIQVTHQDGDQLCFKVGGEADSNRCEQAERRLNALLRETRAYREYYKRVAPAILIETDIE